MNISDFQEMPVQFPEFFLCNFVSCWFSETLNVISKKNLSELLLPDCQPDSLVSVPASDSGCTASRTDKKTFVKRVMKHYYRKFYQISESGLAKYFSEFSSMLYRRTFHAVSWYLIPECQEVAITSYRNCQGCFWISAFTCVRNGVRFRFSYSL